MLESKLGSNVVDMYLERPLEAPSIYCELKKIRHLEQDFENLLSCSLDHPTAKLVASVAQSTSWCHLWDIALHRGVQGTRVLQSLL